MSISCWEQQREGGQGIDLLLKFPLKLLSGFPAESFFCASPISFAEEEVKVLPVKVARFMELSSVFEGYANRVFIFSDHYLISEFMLR